MNFDHLALRLEEKIYRSCKGKIRLTLLEEDLTDFVPGFRGEKSLRILDAGGGSGHFSRICAQKGHSVLLWDLSRAMLNLAETENSRAGLSGRISLKHASFDDLDPDETGVFDLVLLHGAAEWTSNPSQTIRKMMSLTSPGGYLSLLMFNRDKILLKKGINGQLISGSSKPVRKRKLTPPEGMSLSDITELFRTSPVKGTIHLISGIRIFQGFFLQWQPSGMDCAKWLQQERIYYREPPFRSLGEHSHILWKRES